MLAAHSNSLPEGFRQREVRFYMDLFSNWVFVKVNSEPFPLHNTQIMRSLSTMGRLGLVKKMGRSRPPRYKLTRAGVINMLNELISLPLADSYSDFFFVYQFIVGYKSRVIASLKQDTRGYAKTHIMEIESLLNERTFLTKQLELVEYEIELLKERILDSEHAVTLFKELKSKGYDLLKVARAVELKYPFELNSKKRILQVLKNLPESSRESEMTMAIQNRSNLFFKPRLKHLEGFEEILKGLKRQKN